MRRLSTDSSLTGGETKQPSSRSGTLISALSFLYLAVLTGTVIWLALESVQHRQLINNLLASQAECDVAHKENLDLATTKSLENTIPDVIRNNYPEPSTREANGEKKRDVVSDSSLDIVNALQQLTGPPGPPGLHGPPGQPGIHGPPGRDGRDAVNLAAVDSHINSTVRVAVAIEMDKVRLAAEELPSISGAVYTRWGRTTCPSSAELILRGRTGGTYYSERGGSAQYICLPDDPQYGAFHSGGTVKISGVEFLTGSSTLLGRAVPRHNPPCAICQTNQRATQVMLPAKTSCPGEDWTLEYQGYLMTSINSNNRKFAHYRTEFICVDGRAESIPGMDWTTPGYASGALLTYTSVTCGGSGDLGNCPPYYSNRQLACVVCSK